MKIHLLLLIIAFFGLFFSCNSTETFENAKINGQEVVEQKLKIIYRLVVEKKPTDNLNEVVGAIQFLESLTGIESESDGNYLGRYSPTLRDYSRWIDWYELNRESLIWDTKTASVKIINQ